MTTDDSRNEQPVRKAPRAPVQVQGRSLDWTGLRARRRPNDEEMSEELHELPEELPTDEEAEPAQTTESEEEPTETVEAQSTVSDDAVHEQQPQDDYHVDNTPLTNDGKSEAEKDRWMTTKECAQILGCGETTIRDLLKRDQVPVFKLSRVLRIRRSDFDAMVERNMRAL